MVDRLQLPAGSPVVVAARLIVLRGRLRLEDLQLLNRYESRGAVALGVQYQIDAGFLRSEGDYLIPSADLQTASQLALRLQAEAAAAIWADQAGLLADLAELTAALVEGATSLAPVPVPAFATQVETHDAVPITPAGQLLARVTELRYLRADLHAYALGEHGLAGPRARALSTLWKGHSVTAQDAHRLVERGLAETTPSGWALTGRARTIRVEVESTTDDLTAATLGRLPDAESEGLIETLSLLGGDDPRPEADR